MMISIYDWWLVNRSFDDGYNLNNLALYQMRAYDLCIKGEHDV
jgi:hypothetical protein